MVPVPADLAGQPPLVTQMLMSVAQVSAVQIIPSVSTHLAVTCVSVRQDITRQVTVSAKVDNKFMFTSLTLQRISTAKFVSASNSLSIQVLVTN